MDHTDFDLIDNILDGDQQAVRLLIDRHKRYAYTIAVRVVGNEEDAEEVSQDAFVKALKSLKTFNRKSKFSTWLYTIVFHEAVSLKRKKRIQTQDIDKHSGLEPRSPDSLEYKRSEQKYFINKAMEQLKEDDQQVLALFYLKELSLQEVGEILNISTNTVKIKVHRARKRMAAALKGLLKDEVNELL